MLRQMGESVLCQTMQGRVTSHALKILSSDLHKFLLFVRYKIISDGSTNGLSISQFQSKKTQNILI